MREKKPMNKNHLIVVVSGIVAGFSAAIVAIYAWLIPAFFNGYKTYSFLIVGVCGAAVLGGVCCRKANIFTGNAARQIFPYLCALIIAVLVGFFSLLIIVNIRGA